MKMYVSATAGPATPEEMISSVTLVHGTEYYVDCVIEQATPVPTIALTLDGDGAFGAERDSHFPDLTSETQISSIRTSHRMLFTADVTNHLGKVLTCTASNDANMLLEDFDGSTVDQEMSLTVTVIGKYVEF